MNQLEKVFNYKKKEVRTVIKNEEPWFVAKDICSVLGLDNVTRATDRLDDDEKGLTNIQTLGGVQELNIVNEPGLYSLILTSRKPEAKEFKRWVTHEVLPTIRKTGGYISNSDLMVNTYFGSLPEDQKFIVKSLFTNIEEQQKQIASQQKDIEYKEDVIIELVNDVDLSVKRQVLNRVVRHAGIKDIAKRWSELYRQFEMKYHCNLRNRLEKYNNEHKPKLKNKLDYIDQVMRHIPQLYEIACKLYENDVKQLVDEIYAINQAK